MFPAFEPGALWAMAIAPTADREPPLRAANPGVGRDTVRNGEGVAVDGHLEVWTPVGRTLLPLSSDRCTLGSSAECDLVIDDASVSRTHVLFEQLGRSWFVEDLGSRNGTYVNGNRITGRRVVRPGDEIRLGLVRVVLRGVVSGTGPATSLVDEPPVITRREHDVLVALCQPLRAGDLFTEPASVRQIAAALVVSDAAVKQHLSNLFDKFGIVDGERRRVRLANAALSSGAVSLGDLQHDG
jgi:pSer/pThr/pTyr-binding forkhead associated (FHA) protein